jgi:hypothetical protein
MYYAIDYFSKIPVIQMRPKTILYILTVIIGIAVSINSCNKIREINRRNLKREQGIGLDNIS